MMFPTSHVPQALHGRVPLFMDPSQHHQPHAAYQCAQPPHLQQQVPFEPGYQPPPSTGVYPQTSPVLSAGSHYPARMPHPPPPGQTSAVGMDPSWRYPYNVPTHLLSQWHFPPGHEVPFDSQQPHFENVVSVCC